MKKAKKNKKPNIVIYIMSILIFAGLVFFSAKLYLLLTSPSYSFIPAKYITYLLIGLIIIVVFFGIYALLPVNNLNKILSSILSALLATAMAFGSILIPQYKGTFEKMWVEVPTEGTLNINVYVLNDSDIQSILDLTGKKVGTQSQLDSEYQEYAFVSINHELNGKQVEQVSYDDIYSVVEALYAHEIDALLLNETYVDIVGENNDFQTFIDDIRLVYTCPQKIELSFNSNAVENITEQPFTIMIGGNDEWTYNKINNVVKCGRTDVNILAVVNPITKQVLLITIPRDSYLGLDGDPNKKDKLTHATMYSIDCWEKTIEGLFDNEINYYFRVNFSSVINVVDALSGLDINNPYKFTTDYIAVYNPETKKATRTTETFEKGLIHLDGIHALAYCRERKRLSNGDFGRNEHQAIIIQALIDKITSVEGITHIQDLLQSVAGTFATDISLDQIYALAQMQLDDMANWQIVSYSIKGHGEYAYSYTWGSDLSMVMVDENSVVEAKEYLNKIYSNQKITKGE